MLVVRNASREQWLMDQLRESFAKNDRNGDQSHLSDLLNPRRSYWQRVWPIKPTNAETLYWLAGRGHEDALGRVAGLLVITDQRVVNRISYRPDFTLFDVPAEFKTRRSNLAEPGEETVVYETYLEQLRGYCAQESARTGEPLLIGVLMVLSLLEGRSSDPLKPTEPVLAVYDVSFTPEEIEAEQRLLIERRDQFEAALIGWSMEQLGAALGDRVAVAHPDAHAALPLCKAWMCGKPRKVIDTDAFCRACKKEINHKPGHAHIAAGDVTPAVVRWEYEPRCKWHQLCRPWETDANRGARLA